MPRHRERATLESGPRIDLADLIPRGAGRPGTQIGGMLKAGEDGPVHLVAELTEHGGSLTVRHGNTRQYLELSASERHRGGRQWYVRCPKTGRPARVLWKPYGATEFASRYFWGRRAAYSSQFLDPVQRAWRKQAKIKARLIGDLNPDDWELPPKPKRMRWVTYNRMVAKFDQAEEVKDAQLMKVVARFGRL
jgi:hypothetical protein